jgi:hypothetical protein
VKTTEKSSPGWITSHTTAMIATLTTRLIPYMMRPNRELSFMLDFYPIGLTSEHLSPGTGGFPTCSPGETWVRNCYYQGSR